MARTKKARPLTWADATAELDGAGYHLVIPVVERTNAMWRQVKGRTITSARHRLDKTVAPLVLADCTPLAGDVAVAITWYRKARVGDVDSRIKCALDLLAGHCYADDKQVRRLLVTRVDDGSPARLEITVWPDAVSHPEAA